MTKRAAADRYVINEREQLIDTETGEMLLWSNVKADREARRDEFNAGHRAAMSADHRAYALMVDEAAEFGWPTHYRGDLERCDRYFLAQNQDVDRFVWVLRELGTHLLTPDPDPKSVKSSPLQSIGHWARAIERVYPDARWYTWDGRRLRNVTPDRARAFLVESAE